ncbi:DNA/RNA helicase [Shewanella phage S0112]|nr:DNA/RNA helicase [Shewanella phage S0112]
MKLRYYQEEAVASVFDYFHNNAGNPIIAMPTGTGKSVVIAELCRKIRSQYPGQRIMMLTHVKDLIEQNFDKLLTIWPTAPAGIYSAGIGRRDTKNGILYAGIQSVANNPDSFGHIDLIIIDECHRVSHKDDTSYLLVIEALKKINPYLKVIGLSATPWRVGLGLLTNGKIFTDICYDITQMEDFNRLLDEGYLSYLIPKKTSMEYDLSNVRTTGGDYNRGDLDKEIAKKDLTRNALDETVTYAELYDRHHWMVFCTSINHCLQVADILEEYGISYAMAHSKQTNAQNDQAIEIFKQGKVTALINMDKLTTGFDAPHVDLLCILRPTKSVGLWVQILGRGTRVVYASGYPLETPQQRLQAIAAGPKPNCLVLDFAGNTGRLGPINAPVIPDPKKRRKGGNSAGAPIRVCQAKLPNGLICNTQVHFSVRRCPECGTEFPVSINLLETASDKALIASSKDLEDQKRLEWFNVVNVTYSRHLKDGRPDSIRVTYHCGLRRFTDFLCFDHGGAAKAEARQWWRKRSEWEPPPSVDEALKYLHTVATPSRIEVWINRKYPRITDYAFR